MSKSEGLPKSRIRRARCKKVLVILNNRLETLDLIREALALTKTDPLLLLQTDP
jgi:hypothetical protein